MGHAAGHSNPFPVRRPKMKKLQSAPRPLGVINPPHDGWFPANSITNLTLSYARFRAPDFVESRALCLAVNALWAGTLQVYGPNNMAASNVNCK